MAKLTAGPARATRISWRGARGIASSSASPPIGSRVMWRVPMPNRRAVSAWPYSCSSTQTNSISTSASPVATAASDPVRLQSTAAT